VTRQLTLPASASSPTSPGSGALTFIGNATVLLEIAGITILTDPTFIHKHQQTWLGGGLHTTRLIDPAMELADLPPLDLILLSHFHGDHFDEVAERDLDHTLPIVTTPQSAKDLAERGFTQCVPLDVWETLDVLKGETRIRITATPARHGPPLVDLVLPDVMGSLLEITSPGAETRRIYITGDTLIIDELQEIPKRFPEIDLALLHLGGTRVLGILVSMDAAQGVEAMRIVDPELAIPIHYNDYDVFTSSLEEFLQAAQEAGLRERIHVLRHGDRYDFRSLR
jgi:L-ascorbate metabolism protein UlaG (beta-lactamase superfamily)